MSVDWIKKCHHHYQKEKDVSSSERRSHQRVCEERGISKIPKENG